MMMVAMYLVVILCIFNAFCRAQELTATRLHLYGPPHDTQNTGAILYTNTTIPLVIGTLSPVAQPIRFLAGPSGSVRAMEIGSAAETWIRGSLSVGEYTGAAPGEVARIGSVPAISGVALAIDMTGTSQSIGLRMNSIGTTGSEAAGIVLSSASNGTGTGIRIGGPSGSARPTLLTGVDVTGGTGYRYNALLSGSGTGLDIGGTVPPVRGVEATVAGTNNIGVLAKANSAGVGVVGLSHSSAYPTVPLMERIGVLGQAASNSSAANDTLIGVRGISVRGGTGGTATFSVGIFGEAQNTASNHSGYNVGVYGLADFFPNGQGFPIAGLFVSSTIGLAAAHFGGDTFLGSALSYRPPQVSPIRFPQHSQTTTHMFSSRLSGIPQQVNAQTINVATGSVNTNLPISDVPVIRVNTGANGADITGIAGGFDGRIVTLINLGYRLALHNEAADSDPQNRILTPGGVILTLPANGSTTLWYDKENLRWRVFCGHN